MAQQVNFYALEDDHSSILRMAQDVGLLALPRVVETELYELAQVKAVSPRKYRLAQGETYFYLIPDSIAVVEAFYEPMESDPEKSFLMAHVSPVIEFAPSYRLQDRVHHGRLYIDAPTHDPWSPQLYRAYEKLARSIRNWQKVMQHLYVGRKTMRLAKSGQIKLPGMHRKKPVYQSRPLKKAALGH